MMMAPQVVGVLLKKPGQQPHSHHPLGPTDTKIRGELYVEDLGERRVVSIRMGWLWVEGTPMRLALRALNLRQAQSGICQPHALALGFTLSNSNDVPLATFWADTEPSYWSWVRAIATELVRQTPFRSQRCLNFLEILTICPRGGITLPESPPDAHRRSRSELRCWLGDAPLIIANTHRRARSELRCWSSSASSDEDMLGNYRSMSKPWACSESSDGSDDSLPWGGVTSTITLADAPTREQRIQRYKEARRRENDARTKRLLEEDARKRHARAEENNNVPRYVRWRKRDHVDGKIETAPAQVTLRTERVPLAERKNLEDSQNNNQEVRCDTGERRSRARERRAQKELKPTLKISPDLNRTAPARVLDPEPNREARISACERTSLDPTTRLSAVSLSFDASPREEDVARLLERCQRVDRYVPVREKLTLFESLSKMSGRLARSTEDLGSSLPNPSPKEKQRARSLHDLNRGVRTVPVREMCRIFEADGVKGRKSVDAPCVRASTRRRLYQK